MIMQSGLSGVCDVDSSGSWGDGGSWLAASLANQREDTGRGEREGKGRGNKES